MVEKEKLEYVNHLEGVACFMMDAAWHHRGAGTWRNDNGIRTPFGATCGLAEGVHGGSIGTLWRTEELGQDVL